MRLIFPSEHVKMEHYLRKISICEILMVKWAVSSIGFQTLAIHAYREIPIFSLFVFCPNRYI
jgi:hypothetical protein